MNKKLLALLGSILITGVLTGCEPDTKNVSNVTYIGKAFVDDSLLVYLFQKEDQEIVVYMIDSNDNVNLIKGNKYNLKVTRDSIIYKSGFIVQAEQAK